ncbi:MAG: hypothetical protein K6F37_09465 [Lachnospiraceae bacterium]|nr:hypothetical protein [Lachnospiraceae bacterium]
MKEIIKYKRLFLSAMIVATSVLFTGCGNSGVDKYVKEDNTQAETENGQDSTNSAETNTESDLVTEVDNTESETMENDTKDNTTSDNTEAGSTSQENNTLSGMYLGVLNYGASTTNKENRDSFQYRFEIGGEEKIYSIDNGEKDVDGNYKYPVQNKLKEGYNYVLTFADGVISDVTEIKDEDALFTPVVSGTPGEKTLANFIKTALMPVGTTLYVYGGGWDWQDEGSSIQATTLGVSYDWVRFFNEQDENYTYKNENPTVSYYPYGEYNEYYYAGLDCSGFLGWSIYNTFETASGNEGYVGSSTKFAKRLSEYGWGSFTRSLDQTANGYKTKPGDVMSISGHVWISLGTCDDGSTLVLHSTAGAKSVTGQPGGGVEIGAIGYSRDCEAYKIADKYMSSHYPQWYSRYHVYLCDPETYFNLDNENAGLFSWDVNAGSSGLSDNEGIQNMKPDEVLEYFYKES